MAITLKDSSGNVSLTTPVIKQGATNLTNYYTKDETDTAIDTAIQEIDLTPYATKTELEMYDTSYEVDAKIEAIEFPETDLTGYAKETWVTEQIGGIEIPETDLTGYAKETWVTEQLEPYALKTEIPDVSNFATKDELPNLEPYALKTEIPSLDGYATESYVDEKVAEVEVPTATVDTLGVVKPDGETITIDENGVISSVGGGGSVAIDNKTIIKNEDGTIGTAIGGGYEEGLVDGEIIVTVKTDSPSALTYEIAQQLYGYEELWSEVNHSGVAYKNIIEKSQDGDNYIFVVTSFNDTRTATFTCAPDGTTCSMYTHWFSYSVSFFPKVKGLVETPIGAQFIPIGTGLTVNDNKVSLVLKMDATNTGLSLNRNPPASYSLIIGEKAKLTNPSTFHGSIVLGNNSSTEAGQDCFAFNGQAAHNNVAIGTYQFPAYAFSQDSVAIGPNSRTGISMYDGQKSVAAGVNAVAYSNYQVATGCSNIVDRDNTYVFIVGNNPNIVDPNNSSRSNGLTIDWSGNATFAGTVTSAGADYAEFFEWLDGNPDNEDRVGYIVTLDGDKIKLANSDDDILGIISGTATVLGDNAEWYWQGKHLKDDFGRVICDMIEEFEETAEGEKISLGVYPYPRNNPAYDPSQPYINRRNRPEWAMVGMMGKLFVRDDGTAKINGYVTANNGIATASETKTNMRVMKRVTDNIVQVCLK